MCINKEHYTCCCGCSLTTATWILGAFEFLSMVGTGIKGNWMSFAVNLVMVGLYGATVVKRHHVGLRKYLYYAYLTLTIGFT